MASAPRKARWKSGPVDWARSSTSASAPRFTRSAMCLGSRIVATTLSPALTSCSTIRMPVRPWPPMTTMRDIGGLLGGAAIEAIANGWCVGVLVCGCVSCCRCGHHARAPPNRLRRGSIVSLPLEGRKGAAIRAYGWGRPLHQPKAGPPPPLCGGGIPGGASWGGVAPPTVNDTMFQYSQVLSAPA